MTVIHPAPFAAGDGSGNLKQKTAGAILGTRFVARHTGLLTKFHIQFRNLVGDGASYYGGTGGSFIFEFRRINPDGTPDMTAGGLLSTETFLPADARITNYSGYVNANINVVRGVEYALLLKNGDAVPATNYASQNFLYFTNGAPGAQGRNERSAIAEDAYLGLDPREVIMGSVDSGVTWNIPGSTDPDPTTTHHIPVYIQEYSDGYKAGQPYYSAASSVPGTWTITYQNFTQSWRFTTIGSWISDNGGSTNVAVKVDGITRETVVISGNGIHQTVLVTPIRVEAGQVVALTMTVDPTGVAGADIRPIYLRTPQWSSLLGVDAAYPWTSSGTANPIYYSPPVYPLPYTFGTDIGYLGTDDRAYPIKLRDMGDGTYARVIYSATPPGGGTDKTVYGQDQRALTRKLRDMGDGTFAPTIAGGNF